MEENNSIIKDPQIRRGVIASIIASLIVLIFVQPLLRIIWAALLKVGLEFVQAYVDSIYRNAALGQRNDVDVIILFFIFAILLGLISGITLVAIRHVFPAKKKVLHNKKRKVFQLCLIVLFLYFIIISSAIKPFTDLQFNTSFQQRLTILSPKITELELKEFEAAWALMQSRKDFEAINNRMEETAKKYGVVLPPNLLK